MSNSVEVTPLAVQKQSGFLSGRWQTAALVLLGVWLYAATVANLFEQWIKEFKDYGHGPIVPAFAAFVLWENWNRLKRVKAAPSWTGAAIVIGAMLLLVVGQLGAELFLSRVSLLILLAGLIILFRGWTFFRNVLFPWASLFLMIPIPKIILQNITFPLQMVASKLATDLLRLFQVPVYREGNVINLPVMPLEVVEACSGIRSLLSLITLAIIYGYLLERRIWVRVVLAVSSVPIAIAANGFRIFGTGMVAQQWGKDKADGFLHTFEGWLVFVVSLVMLFLLHGLISRIWPDRQSKSNNDDLSAKAEHDNLAQMPEDNSPPGVIRRQTANFAVSCLIMLSTAIFLQAHSEAEVFPPREPLSALPHELGGWVGTDYSLDEKTLQILGPGEFLTRDYSDPSHAEAGADLFIAYYASQRVAETPHSPDRCLAGAGFIPTQRQIVQLPGPNGSLIPANRYIVSKGNNRSLVLYWFQAHGRVLSSQYASKYYLVADSLRMNRSDGSMVRLITPMYPKESPDSAQSRLWALGTQVAPLLDRYIPR